MGFVSVELLGMCREWNIAHLTVKGSIVPPKVQLTLLFSSCLSPLSGTHILSQDIK